MADFDDQEHVVDYIRIERGLDNQGIFINVTTSDDLHMLEALGMLEFAKMNLIAIFKGEQDES